MPTGACTGDTVLITYTGNASSSAIYYWSLGNSFIASTNGVDSFYVVWNSAGLDSVYLQIDQNGCISNITKKFITILSKPVAAFTLTDSVCSSVQAVATFTGSVPLTSQYDWNFGSGIATPGGTLIGPQNISFNTAGYNIVSLIVNDQGCKSVEVFDSVFITIAPSAVFTISDDSLCGAETTLINYTGTAGAAALYNYNFGTATINSGSGSGPYDIGFASAGWHYITLSVTENGCTSTVKTDSIISAADAVADAGSDVNYCNGDSAIIGVATIPGYTYSWSPASAVSKSNIANPYAILTNNTGSSTVTNLILTAKNNFCIDKDTVIVTVDPRQLANIAVTPAIIQCLDVNNFNFSNNSPAITGSTYNWNFTPFANTPTATTAAVSNINYATAGVYLVQLNITTGTCPVSTDTFTIAVTDAAKADFTADDTTGCPPVDVTFTDKSNGVLAGSTYLWTFGNGTASMLAAPALVSYNTSGNYTVTLAITSPNGCVSTKSKTNYISVYNKPVASFTPDPSTTNILQPVISFYGTSTNADTCKYSFGDGTTGLGCFTQHEYLDTGTFVVMLVALNAGGCSDTAYQTVVVNDFYTIYIPNSFTPNGDGINDYFSISGFGIKTFSINVFNRQGAIVYTSKNSNFVWDGKDTNGSLLMEGNYVYQIEVKDVLNKSHTINGSLLIIM
jgi:gliding motility-associated-like protein